MSEVCTLMAYAIVIAAVAAFFILFMEKTGYRDKMIANSPKLISQMYDCDFCLSFWVSAVFSTGIVLGECNLIYVLIPFISAPITRRLL